MTTWLSHLAAENPTATKKHVYTVLGIDVKARKNRKEDTLEDYRKINKGLAMELLVALSLRHLDKPEYVQSMCCFGDDSGHPCNFAPSDHPDLVSYYKTPTGQKNFYILSEVSAMHEMSQGDYRSQLDKAWSHAKEIVARNKRATVYALVINGAYSDMSTKKKRSQFQQYRAFKKDKRLRINSRVRVIPLNRLDFITLMLKVYEQYRDIGQHLESRVLESALSQTYNLLRQEQTPAKAKWIMQSLIDRLAENATQQLGFDERNDAEDDGR